MKRVWLMTAIVGTWAATAHAGTQLSYADLVRKLTDLEGLAVLPVPGEKCQQWSSYDRQSQYDPNTGKYINWGANADDKGIIRHEGDVDVMAEMRGPGVIWRMWAAAPKAGHVKIYLDDANEPTFDMPYSAYFDSKHAPLDYPTLVQPTSGGWNCYVPIPFQKSCKIVGEKDWGAYYHFTYTTYPADTVLPTFAKSLSAADAAALTAADRFLREKLGTDPAGDRPGTKTETQHLTLRAGSNATAAKLDGPQAITAIRAKFDPNQSVDMLRTLREVTLKITWDGEARPGVWTPLGDFFGTAPGVNKLAALPCGMSRDGQCYALWYMPFAQGALVELANDGKTDFPLEISVTHAPLTRPIEQLGRFHAKWHRDIFLNADTGRPGDWPLLKADGRGRYCGVLLCVWNPRGGWWGEGDEKFFIDGEKFPSTFGTGSEDYFGYGWCSPELFQNAYHNQTLCDNPPGNVSVDRWQITDNVPFQQSFEGDIEKDYPNTRPTLYAATAYFYLAAGQADRYDPLPVAERTDFRTPLKIYHEPDALEGEAMKVLESTGGSFHPHRMLMWGDGWSGGYVLWWEQPRPGNKLTLQLPVKQAGTYDVVVQFTKTTDCAIIQPYIDGEKLGGPLDMYGTPDVIEPVKLTLGSSKLTAGDHKFMVEVVGANPKAGKAYQVYIDYVKLLEKAE